MKHNKEQQERLDYVQTVFKKNGLNIKRSIPFKVEQNSNIIRIYNAKVFDIGTDCALLWQGDLNLSSDDFSKLYDVSKDLKTELAVTLDNDYLFIDQHEELIIASTIYGLYPAFKTTMLLNTYPFRLYQYNVKDEESIKVPIICGKCKNYNNCNQEIKGKYLASYVCEKRDLMR